MAKFSAEEKLQIVLRYLNDPVSYLDLQKEYRISRSIILGWVRLYEFHGEDAFLKPYTSYSQAHKLDVLNYMSETGASSYEAAAIFNISSPSLVRRWRDLFKKGGMDALQTKKKGRPSMKKEIKKPASAEGTVEALQAKIERLEMENAYLKKLNALVQIQEKLQTKLKRK